MSIGKRVVIFFNPQILPYLSNLKANFTQYLQSDISDVSGAYTIRFYELICQYRTIGKREVSIQDLRFILNIGDKYPLFYDFKKRVIEPAIKEINEKTPMQISYEQKKKGKTIVGIVLNFKEKPKKENKAISTVSKRDPNTVDLIAKMTDKQRFSFAKKLSDMPEMSKYSHGTESYEQFAIRIADMLLDPEKRKELAPYLVKAGFNEKPC